jgi:hypothetical protein
VSFSSIKGIEDCKALATRMPLTSISCTIENRLKFAGLGSKSLSLHLLEFVAARVAEVS